MPQPFKNFNPQMIVMASSTAKKSTKSTLAEWIPLLDKVYDNFFTPINWEESKKATNYFARISKGGKSIFDRKFLNSTFLDDQVVYRGENFPEGEIIEQKAVYVKGKKRETTFHGFFIIHHDETGIFGEQISQKEALEFFDCESLLPEVADDQKNKLRMKLGTVVRKLSSKYGDEVIAEILTEILESYFPKL